MPNQDRANNNSHIPSDSPLFEKVIPGLLIVMSIIMLGLMLFAAAVLLGVVHF